MGFAAENKRMNAGIALFIIVVLAGVLLSGCLVEEVTGKKSKSTPTSTPTPTATVKASATSTPTPTPASSASPTATATPTPSPTVQGQCTINVNPAESQGPFRAIESVRFFDLDNPSNVTVKCNATDLGALAEKKGNFYVRFCDYPSVQARQIVTASASAKGVSCAADVVIQTNQLFSKSWSFLPDDESFTMNQSVSNSSTRNYTITNNGNLELTLTSCSVDKSFVSISCGTTSIKPGENALMSATYSISNQAPGQQSVVLSVKEKDLDKQVRVSLTIVT